MSSATRLAGASVITSALLSVLNLWLGLAGRSTAVTAVGLELAGDVASSAVVMFGLLLASKPADSDHPYGHGRIETLAGLLVGLLLVAGGALICIRSLSKVSEVHPPPEEYTMWALAASVLVKSLLSALKFHYGRRVRSAALVADAWNDAVDILSGMAAMAALTLALTDPHRFLSADHYGGFAVGLVIIYSGLRVSRDSSLELIDTMPNAQLLEEVRRAALAVEDVWGVEKLYARKTGLQYHVDVHVEMDPRMTVRDSHEVARQVRTRVREAVPAVADVLVHVEPAGGMIE